MGIEVLKKEEGILKLKIGESVFNIQESAEGIKIDCQEKGKTIICRKGTGKQIPASIEDVALYIISGQSIKEFYELGEYLPK